MEGNFNWYDDFDAEAGPIDFEVKIWTFMLDLKAMYPFYEDRLTPYLRIGGGYMDAELKSAVLMIVNQTSPLTSESGLDYYVTDQISIGPNAKYVWGTGDLDDWSTLCQPFLSLFISNSTIISTYKGHFFIVPLFTFNC